jgi:methionine aminotransferase
VGAIINLSQGFPDFDCDPSLVEAVARHMREGHNQLRADAGAAGAAPGDRDRPTRTLHGAKLRSGYRSHGDVGRHEAIFNGLVAMVIHPGDEAIVFEPCYELLRAGNRAEWRPGRSSFASLSRLLIPWDEVRAAVNRRPG